MLPVSSKDHFVYWILPSSVTLLCSIVYFLNLFGLAEFVAPDFNREFGLVENIQLILLLTIFYFCLKGFKIRTVQLEKYGFLFLAFATAFIFLEEIDYGLHYIEYYSGKPTAAVNSELAGESKLRNLHNAGNLNGKFKFTSYIIIVLFFVIMPLIPQRIKERYALIQFFSSSKMIVTTAISLLITNKLVYHIYNNYNYYNRSLNNNVTEFEEIMIYYIIMLYIMEMVKKPEGLLLRKAKSYSKPISLWYR